MPNWVESIVRLISTFQMTPFSSLEVKIVNPKFLFVVSPSISKWERWVIPLLSYLFILFSPQRNIHGGVRPSIAALAGSIDKNAAQYTFVADVTADPIIASNLKEMMIKTLVKFYRMNNQAKPAAIVMYRSGVSDAEKEKVSGFELDLIQKACHELEGTYE